jgi:hypothetical protein
LSPAFSFAQIEAIPLQEPSTQDSASAVIKLSTVDGKPILLQSATPLVVETATSFAEAAAG